MPPLSPLKMTNWRGCLGGCPRGRPLMADNGRCQRNHLWRAAWPAL